MQHKKEYEPKGEIFIDGIYCFLEFFLSQITEQFARHTNFACFEYFSLYISENIFAEFIVMYPLVLFLLKIALRVCFSTAVWPNVLVIDHFIT